MHIVIHAQLTGKYYLVEHPEYLGVLQQSSPPTEVLVINAKIHLFRLTCN